MTLATSSPPIWLCAVTAAPPTSCATSISAATERHQRRYRALAAALGCDLEAPPDHSGQRAAQGLITSTVESLESVATPFDGMMEAPRQTAELYVRHGPDLHNAAELLRAHHRALLVDLVELAYGLASSRSVTEDDLRSAGFDPSTPAPDPVDFW